MRREVSLVLAAVAAYELARRAIHPSLPAAVEHAHRVLEVERRLGLAWEAPLQHTFAPVGPAFAVLYLAAQFAVTGLFLLWLYRTDRERYPRFRNAFMAATAVALAVQARYPVAPPRLVGLHDTVAGLVGMHVGSVTDPLAAMPSLHAGWAVGVGAGIWRRSRVLGVLYPTVVVLATLVTGNHFVLDAAAGAVLMGAALALAHADRLELGGTIAPATRGGAVR